MGFGKDYVVGWGTLALVNAGLAQAKGRSGLTWFLASLFLGPIATLAIVALDRGDVPALAQKSEARPLFFVLLGVIAVAMVIAILGRP